MFNMNSGYGQHEAGGVLRVRSTTGKAFLIAKNTTPDLSRLKEIFKPDGDGAIRIFSSIEEALNSGDVLANRGDVLVLAPGHTEAVSSAGAINLDIAGVTIVGLGSGSLRPTFTFSGVVGADINVDAADNVIENCIFDLTGVDNLTAPIDVNAANFKFLNNYVLQCTAAAQAPLAILTDANASGMDVIGCEFVGSNNGGGASAIRLVGGSDIRIINNRFHSNYAAVDGAINNITTAVTRLTIRGNVINNLTAGSTKAITVLAGTTGEISDNRMQILSGTAPITAAGMSWVGANYYANAVATAGTLI
jgi:hypothetical protein